MSFNEKVNAMPMLRFVNRTAESEHEIHLHNKSDCEPIMDWYGGFHAGDDYDVYISGKKVATGINGELVRPTIDGSLAMKTIEHME